MKNLFVFCLICNGFILYSQNKMNHQIIPNPVSVKSAGGRLNLNDVKQIIIPEKNKGVKKIAEFYIRALNQPDIKIIETKNPHTSSKKSIILQLLSGENSSDYYTLNSSKNGIKITASQERGLFYALQSLIQIIEKSEGQNNKSNLTIPYINIEDDSRFKYRGLHLDVSRHFFPVSFIKNYIDMMAKYKYNYFHWHLTDDQGWRIEIKQFPELTQTGGYRKSTLIGHYSDSPAKYDSTEYGGYYTQDEIREVIKYAADRYIEIIPEIEMPGHSSAALAAYPIFGCTGGPYEVANTWGVFEDVFCTKDTTIWFLKEILKEVCDLFPGEYIHIGGDECPKGRWKACPNCQAIKRRRNIKTEEELQSYFISQIGIFLTSKGKKLIGWDEILEGGIPTNAIIMSWRGEEGGILAAKAKHQVIMTPGSHCYFDHYQSTYAKEPLAIGSYLPLERVYSYNPIPTVLTKQQSSYILGAQGNVWTEYMSDENKVFYMAYPRAIALAEVNWTEEKNKSYSDFIKRLHHHSKWFKENNISFSLSYLDLNYKTLNNNNHVELIINKPALDGSILLETIKDGDAKQEYSSEDTFILDKTLNCKAWYQLKDKTLSRPITIDFISHLGAGKNITLINSPAEKYFQGGPSALLNGIQAPQNKYGGQEWIGMEGKNFEAIIDYKDTNSISALTFQFFNAPGSWIHLPSEVVISASSDGKNFEIIKQQNIETTNLKYIEPKILLDKKIIPQYLKILVKNHGEIEEHLPGAGHGSWLFIGEIKLE